MISSLIFLFVQVFIRKNKKNNSAPFKKDRCSVTYHEYVFTFIDHCSETVSGSFLFEEFSFIWDTHVLSAPPGTRRGVTFRTAHVE